MNTNYRYHLRIFISLPAAMPGVINTPDNATIVIRKFLKGRYQTSRAIAIISAMDRKPSSLIQ